MHLHFPRPAKDAPCPVGVPGYPQGRGRDFFLSQGRESTTLYKLRSSGNTQSTDNASRQGMTSVVPLRPNKVRSGFSLCKSRCRNKPKISSLPQGPIPCSLLYCPVPLNAILCGDPVALSVIVTAAVKAPVTFGAK